MNRIRTKYIKLPPHVTVRFFDVVCSYTIFAGALRRACTPARERINSRPRQARRVLHRRRFLAPLAARFSMLLPISSPSSPLSHSLILHLPSSSSPTTEHICPTNREHAIGRKDGDVGVCSSAYQQRTRFCARLENGTKHLTHM